MNYEEMKKATHKGFNTWNNLSILSYVHLPDAFSVTLGFKEYSSGAFTDSILIGRKNTSEGVVVPSYHAFDGSYCELELSWFDARYKIRSSCLGDDFYVLITPVQLPAYNPHVLAVESAVLWGRDGYVNEEDGILTGHMPQNTFKVYHTGTPVQESAIFTSAKYQTVVLDREIALSTGRPCPVDEVRRIIEEERRKFLTGYERFGEDAETFKAMQSCLAWDTIYEPVKSRIVSPVSRLWSAGSGGCVLFCWDTYFAALMAMATNKELAYSNAIEITREKTEKGFVPNFAHPTGFKSRDRSQPPVGSYVINRIYEKYGEKWFLEEVFDDLFVWNRWWFEHRQIEKGLFAWGSDPYKPINGNFWELNNTDCTAGAALESGLDNSPMYDGKQFDPDRHIMLLADVGLTSLVLLDCHALEKIALALGRREEAEVLHRDAALIEQAMDKLWDEEKGFYYNYDYSTGAFSPRISPTNFYALCNSAIPGERVRRILQEHFYNEKEFWGEYILPSISRDDPAFHDNNYWRGRIWAPMNMLAYIGLMNHAESRAAAHDLAVKSRDLILREWLEHGHVHENYNAETGEGCDVSNSDRFYHWGGLLSYIYLDETGKLS